MPQIVISYRRDDTAAISGRICDHLKQHFGDDSVFMDVDNIPLGQDFGEYIKSTLQRCDVLLAVIGPGWQSRLNDPNDWVRMEVEAALAKNIPVIPVLIGRTEMPKMSVLPESLRALAFRNAATLDPSTGFRRDVEDLIRRLYPKSKETTAVRGELSSASGQRIAANRLLWAVGIAIVLIGSLIMWNLERNAASSQDSFQPAPKLAAQTGARIEWAECKKDPYLCKYDEGLKPAVTMNSSGIVVEVHNAGEGVGELWVKAGQLNGTYITWAAHGARFEPKGRNPAIAVNDDGVVVEVHNEGASVGPLSYRVGRLQGLAVDWGPAAKYEEVGQDPKVAIRGSTVVEVHNTGNGQGPLFYRVGQISASTIMWGAAAQYDQGHNPAVAIRDDGTLIEVHEAGEGALRSRVGRLNGSNIQWEESVKYDDGLNPNIAVAGTADVVEVHNVGPGTHALSYRLGQLSGSIIRWEKPDPIGDDKGQDPAVAANVDRGIVAVYNSVKGVSLQHVGRIK